MAIQRLRKKTRTKEKLPLRIDGSRINEIIDNINALEYGRSTGNIIYVPITGNIQEYVNSAKSGDTLILASGRYDIVSTITINKELNIVGQGNSGFITEPITPSHGTLIASNIAGVTAFMLNHNNIRISSLSINLTGSTSLGINTGDNLLGLVFTNIDLIINCDGWAAGFTVTNSSVVMRDLTFYITSSDFGATGVVFDNNSSATQDTVCDCFNVTGTVKGALVNAFCYLCRNNNSEYTITLNLSNSVCKSLTGTPLDVGVASMSTTTNNAIVNAYFCTFDGHDYDAYQTGTNQLNLGDSVIVNNKTSGTVTYRATMISNIIRGTTLNMSSITEHADNAAAILAGLTTGDFYRTGDVLKIVHA